MMFEKARIKLTIWYLVIIVVISLFFSFAIYSNINGEYQKFERKDQEYQQRVEQNPSSRLIRPKMDPIDFDEARMRLVTTLGFINLLILGLSGVAGYFLAGRTLRPIKEMMDDQNRFISDASHELRTPITSLRSEIEVALRNKKLNLKKAKVVLASNMEEVKNLQYLSDDLILLAQNKKSNEPYLKKISISAVIKESILRVEKIAKNKNIKIKNLAADSELNGDYQNLIKLFVIILDNAIKYSPPKTSVVVSSNKKNNKLTILISDKGKGINSRDLPYIFNRFYRSDESINEDGYGLGLSMAKLIVAEHRGSIKVKSIKDKGTTFIIDLPL